MESNVYLVFNVLCWSVPLLAYMKRGREKWKDDDDDDDDGDDLLYGKKAIHALVYIYRGLNIVLEIALTSQHVPL